MHFFGYIPSLALAIGLLVFYMGNLTQCLIVKINEESQSLKEIRIQDTQTNASYSLNLEIYTQFADKYNNNKSTNYYQAYVKNLSKIIPLKEQEIRLKEHPPFMPVSGKYALTLFSRPPPQVLFS